MHSISLKVWGYGGMNMSNFNSLKAAESLQDAGFEVQQAEAVVGTVTQALNENLATQDDLRELSERMATQDDLRELSERMATQDDLRELSSRLEVLENKVAVFDSRLDAIDARFEAIDHKFEAVNTRLDAIDHKFEAVNTRLDAIDHKFEAINTRLDMLNSKIDNLAKDLAQKLTIRLGGVLLAAIVLLEVLNRIFPVVPAP